MYGITELTGFNGYEFKFLQIVKGLTIDDNHDLKVKILKI